jgi:hypothetical protein
MKANPSIEFFGERKMLFRQRIGKTGKLPFLASSRELQAAQNHHC